MLAGDERMQIDGELQATAGAAPFDVVHPASEQVAGRPAGVFNVVVSNANEVGAALSADPRVDMITFTGSTATGRAILAAGARRSRRRC